MVYEYIIHHDASFLLHITISVNQVYIMCMISMLEICPRGNNKELLLSYFIVHNKFILHAIIVLSGNFNTCVVCKQHRVPSKPLLD